MDYTMALLHPSPMHANDIKAPSFKNRVGLPAAMISALQYSLKIRHHTHMRAHNQLMVNNHHQHWPLLVC